MLITRWLRVRSPPCRVLCQSERHIRQQFHSTPSQHRNLPSPSKIVQPLYVDTLPPTKEQTHAAEIFFRTHLPTKSWTATEWRQQPHSESAYLVPEVAFLGRSNSGKSSLLNGLLFDDKLCRVGAKPGKTITMHAWSLSPVNPETRGARKGHQGDMEPKLTVLDMPGYGHGSHGEWGAAIMKYLTARRQLRRAFVLVNPLHGLKEQDLQMLELLRGNGIPHQMIACKADRMKVAEAPGLLQAMQTQIDQHFSRKRQVPLLMTVKDILTVGGLAQTKEHTSRWLESAQGLHDIRWAILRAAGLEEYAVTLAANGGVMPKEIQDKSASIEQDNPDEQPISRPLVLPEQNHMLEDEHQTDIAPEDTSRISLNAKDMVSDTFNPMFDHSNDSKPNITNGMARFGANDSVNRSTPTHQREPRPQSTSSGPLAGRARATPGAKTRDTRSSTRRTKDVKRYGVKSR